MDATCLYTQWKFVEYDKLNSAYSKDIHMLICGILLLLCMPVGKKKAKNKNETSLV